MKRTLIPSAVLFLALGLSGSAFAKAKSVDIEIYQPSQVAGTTLQPGNYKVQIDPNGTTAQVIFTRNGKQVATATGQVVQLAKKPASTSVTVDTTSSVPSISEIDLEGSQTAVSFAGVAAAASSGE